MKRIVCIMALVFGATPFLFAGDKNKESEMTGTFATRNA